VKLYLKLKNYHYYLRRSAMRRLLNLMSVVVLLALFGGCATAPIGPTVSVMPAPGKSLEAFQKDCEECKAFALQQMGGQKAVDAAQQKAATEAVVGTALGAGVGAAIGSGVGDAGGGAAVGAGAGLAAGTVAGANSTVDANARMQQLYDAAYAQCMYAKGNRVAGQVQPSRPPTCESATPYVAFPSPRTIYVIKPTVNIREGAGENCTIISHVNMGDALIAVGEKGEWYWVNLDNGQEGYVYEKLVSYQRPNHTQTKLPVSPPSSPPTPSSPPASPQGEIKPPPPM
jgi:hypothetical protein